MGLKSMNKTWALFLFCCNGEILFVVVVVVDFCPTVLEGNVVECAKKSLQGLFSFSLFQLAFPHFDGVPSLCLEC